MTAERIFLVNGLLRQATMKGGWIPLVVRLVVDLDFTAWQLLLMGTAIELGILLGEIPTGVVADTFSRKWSVIAGVFVLGAAQFSSALLSEFPYFLGTQFVWGIGWTFISGAEIAWVTDEIGSAEATEPLLLRRARLQFVAAIVGMAAFAGIGQLVSLQASVLLAGSVGIAWALVLSVQMRETGFRAAGTGGRGLSSDRITAFVDVLRAGARFTWHTTGLRVLGLTLLIGGVAAEVIDRTNIRRLEDIGLSTSVSAIGVFAAVSAAQMSVAALLLWRWERGFVGQRVAVAMGVLLAAAGVFVFVVAHVPVLALAAAALVVQGALLNLTDPLMTTWTNALAPSASRATVHSFIGQMRAMGEIAGGLVLGAVASVFTLPTALTAAAALFIVAGLNAARGRRLLAQGVSA